jgi:hypothetical protein
MAIDTAEKRRSAAGTSFRLSAPGVTPTVAKDLEWRQQAGWGYSGIPTSGGAVGGGDDALHLGVEHSLGVTPVPIVGGWIPY